MHHRPGKFIWVLWVVALLTLLAAAAPAAEFSAIIVTNSRGEERQGKIYIKGDKIRREFVNPGDTTIFIVPGDKKIMWMLEPLVKTYKELPFDKDAYLKSLNQPQDKSGSKLLGTETLNGYATDKYETAVKTPTGTYQGTIWFAKKLGVALRIETADRSFVQEYKDIKEGGVDDAVFELPPGYHKKAVQPNKPKNE
jgi:outer membrane lipoprotein-sorting protein